MREARKFGFHDDEYRRESTISTAFLKVGVTHPLLEQADLLLGESIGLCNDGNQVDFLVKSPHELDINWFESGYQLAHLAKDRESLRMTGRLNEVDTSMYTVINEFEPVDSVLLL